jgi:hypothetical protein
MNPGREVLRILLLDLDDVLIEQVAYHRSLKECVERIGRWCGFEAVRLTDEDIAFFESLGVTSEWDSSAICTALLLDRAWSIDPARRLPDTPTAPDGHPHRLAPPDFQSFFRSELDGALTGLEARARVEGRLLEGSERTLSQRQALRAILRSAYDPESSLTHRIIQELNLGAVEYEACYGRPAAIPGPGYLSTIDPPLITPKDADRLAAWATTPGNRAVIFTNRPSRLPDGSGGMPEAEIGLARVGLSSLPFVAMGHLDWLCDRRGLEAQTLLKPSAVHALAALRRAAGDSLAEALPAAARLGLDQDDDGRWRRLDAAQAIVFEDSFRGLQSARGAQQALRNIGVRLELELRGVTTLETKRRALQAVGGVIYPDFTSAAQDILTGGA